MKQRFLRLFSLSALTTSIACSATSSVTVTPGDPPPAEECTSPPSSPSPPGPETSDACTQSYIAAFDTPDTRMKIGPAGCAATYRSTPHDRLADLYHDPLIPSLSGSASLEADVLTLECAPGERFHARATVGCYRGPGLYAIPAGAAIIAGHTNKAPCTVAVSDSDGVIRGNLTCFELARVGDAIRSVDVAGVATFSFPTSTSP